MKKIITIITIIIISISLSGCNSNNQKKENNPNTKLSENISSNIINELIKTDKIIIKNNGSTEILGTITDTDTIDEIINILKTSKITGDAFNCDGYGFNFLMFNNNKLIDTIHIWTQNERLIPSSISQGCSYYTVTSSNNPLKNIIEKYTDHIFYTIYDYSEECDTALELIYEDNKYKYYFECIKSDNVFIEFQTSNRKITLKEALNNNEINIEEILNIYPHILIKKEK